MIRIFWTACFIIPAARADITIVERGKPLAAIFAPAEVVGAKDVKHTPGVWINSTPEVDLQRLRDSVRDLAHYLEKISGAKMHVVAGAPARGEKRLPILIGTLATERFGPPQKKGPFKQGGRLVVAREAVGIIGESDLATSYVIYDILHRLGCRWYMPSEMGEVIPKLKTIEFKESDEFIAPYTSFRSIWFADDNFGRRNRLGGPRVQMSHALEGYVSKELREKQPEWQAMHKGKPSGRRLKWSRPGVAEAIAGGILNRMEAHPATQSISLSPDDGLGYDDTDDTKLDTGDFDPTLQDISITDRQVWLCNRVIDIVARKHPSLLFGMLAYGQSARPPLREKPHKALVPVFAPITYRRAHPMTDDAVPDNKSLRAAIEGWAKLSPRVGYYFYGWLLAEPSAPNPFITKWSEDLRFIYQKGNCRFWDPETFANFESTMHALTLGIRMSWDPTQQAEDIIRELHQKFYGRAAEDMARYWHFIDRTWVGSPEYSGCGFGHLRRWPVAKLTEARRLMNRGLKAARSPEVKFRVKMADEGLQLFELFMKLRGDLAAGRFERLEVEANRYTDWAKQLATTYKPQYAFGGAYYLRGRDITHYARYFKIFYQQTYNGASKVANESKILTRPPMRTWRFLTDKDKKGEAAGWSRPEFDDSRWKVTDPAIETWSTIGHHSYMGAMWYRTKIDLPTIPEGKKVHLWLGATDGSAKVFVNGKHVPYADAKGETKESFSGYCSPAPFEVTPMIRSGETNHIAILCERTFVNELGTGGLLSPVVIYRERD